MPKWPIKKLLQIPLSTYVVLGLCILAVAQLLSSCGVYNYRHVPPDQIPSLLYKAVNPNLVPKKSKPDCNYDHVLKSTKFINTWEVPEKFEDFDAKGINNGSYSPEHCNPLISVALLVTYRNRQSQLDLFLPYMHNFLRKQNIHYKIYVIEQQDEKPWNKGLLYNIGAKQAMADKFPCLILHDVDLLPLTDNNLYACLQQPRHLSASIDKFRFVLIFYELIGGVFAIRTDQYLQVNGFSNKFEAWGGEDDDFETRIVRNDLDIVRFPRAMSVYSMLVHRPEPRNAARLQILADNRRAPRPEGFGSASARGHSLAHHRLFTLLAVRL